MADPAFKFIIVGRLPTENQIIAAAKEHFGVYSKMKKESTQKVVDCIKHAQNPPPQFSGTLHLRITWVSPNRRTNKDNIEAGQKFIWDGLVDAGVIPNDGWTQQGNKLHQHLVDKNFPHIIVEVFAQPILL